MISATKAFVSHVRAYKEHQLTFIFTKYSLNLGYLASSFGLLRLPRVKEILGHKVEGFQRDEMDPNNVPFQDPAKEAQRQLELPGRLAEQAARASQREKDKLKNAKSRIKAVTMKKRTRSQAKWARRRAAMAEWEHVSREG